MKKKFTGNQIKHKETHRQRIDCNEILFFALESTENKIGGYFISHHNQKEKKRYSSTGKS